MAFTSGAYMWYWRGSPLGVVADTPEITLTHFGQPINADVFGGRPIDYIFQGMEVTLDIVFQEYRQDNVQSLLAQHSRIVGGAGFNGSSNVATIGCPMVDNYGDVLWGKAASFHLTNTEISCTFPTWFISRRVTVALDTPITLLMGTGLRVVPIRFQLNPYEFAKATGNFHHWEFYNDTEWQALNDQDKRDVANSVQDALNPLGP